MPVNEDLIEDCGTYFKIDGMYPEGTKAGCCPFCDGRITSGLWALETCVECGSVYTFNAWILARLGRVLSKARSILSRN